MPGLQVLMPGRKHIEPGSLFQKDSNKHPSHAPPPSVFWNWQSSVMLDNNNMWSLQSLSVVYG